MEPRRKGKRALNLSFGMGWDILWVLVYTCPLVDGDRLASLGEKAKVETVHCFEVLDHLLMRLHKLSNTQIFQLQISLFLAVKRPN